MNKDLPFLTKVEPSLARVLVWRRFKNIGFWKAIFFFVGHLLHFSWWLLEAPFVSDASVVCCTLWRFSDLSRIETTDQGSWYAAG